MVAPRQIRNDAFPGIVIGFLTRKMRIKAKTHFLALCAVKNGIHHLFGCLADRAIRRPMAGGADGMNHFVIIRALCRRRKRRNGPFVDGQIGVGNAELGIHSNVIADAVAIRASALRTVKR